MTDTPVDYQLVTTLQRRVADEMTRAKQHREARGERELSEPDDRQLAFSVITAVVQRHLASVLSAGGELPVDAGYDLKLIMAVDAAMYEAAEFTDLITDQLIENVDINGCDEVFITYADARGKGPGPADRRDGRRVDPDRAEPGLPGFTEPAAVQPGEPGAGSAAAGRVPVVGGDVGGGAAGGVDPPVPVPADVPVHPGRPGHGR